MKQWWPIMIASLLVLGGCGKVATTPTAEVNSPTAVPTQIMTAKTALKDLLAGGKVEKCTWSAVENGNGVSGTLYVSGKEFRQETVTTDAKTQAKSQNYSLSDGTTIYTWGGMMGGRGIKISMASLENMVTGTPSGSPSQVNSVLNQQYQYQCEPWTADDSQFVPPTNITFSDMSQLIKNMQGFENKYGK
jgi:hypothetical protein